MPPSPDLPTTPRDDGTAARALRLANHYRRRRDILLRAVLRLDVSSTAAADLIREAGEEQALGAKWQRVAAQRRRREGG